MPINIHTSTGIANDWARVIPTYLKPFPETKHTQRGKYIHYKNIVTVFC